MKVSQKTVIVVGGGISGLSIAYGLRKLGHSVRLLEKEKVPGGFVKSYFHEGYLVEAGPNSTLDQHEEVQTLCSDLGLDESRIPGNPVSKKRYLVKNGKLIAVPLGFGAFLKTDLWSMRGKLRLLKEPFVKKGEEKDESVASFFERRLGREMVEYGIDPFVSGIYAGDPCRLSVRSTFPRLFNLEQDYGSLLKGVLFKGKKKRKETQKGLFSFKSGMGELTQGLSHWLGESVQSGWEVKELDYQNNPPKITVKGVTQNRGVACDGDAVVLATPAYWTSHLIHPLCVSLSEHLKGIHYAPIAMVFLGFDRTAIQHPLDGFGCLIPSREGFDLLGSLWNSTLFPGRAPEGCIATTNFLGGARKPEILEASDEQLIDIVIKELNQLIGVQKAPQFSKVIRYPYAIPQFQLGYTEKIIQIEKRLEDFPGIFLGGNFLKGVSVADCILNGLHLSKKVDAFFAVKDGG
jgi:oxygen-dependent protoporphyrinogen oxidase